MNNHTWLLTFASFYLGLHIGASDVRMIHFEVGGACAPLCHLCMPFTASAKQYALLCNGLWVSRST